MVKDNIKDKKKHPMLKSLWQIFLFCMSLVGLYVIIDSFDENSIVANGSFRCVLYLICFIGSVLLLIKNFSGRNYMKEFMSISIIAVVISVILIVPDRMKRLEEWENSICGRDGELYYCGSEEPITCDDGNYAVYDADSYKCIGSDEYRHDILGEEYDYPCIGKYEKEDIIVDEVTSLMLQEKACLEPKIETALKEIVDAKKQDITVSNFDIRNKVTVTVGNQGRSDTCEIWSSTKALEISAQLKGLDYQFLIDFEKKINGLTPNLDGIINSEDNTVLLGSDYLIPGKKKYYYLSDNSDKGEDYENIPIYRSNQLLMLMKQYINILSRVYADKNGYNIYDDIDHAFEYEKELRNLYAKELVMKYGSAFIQMSENIQPGHRMLIIGWDDSKEAWLVLNSWGNTWAQDEYIPASNGDGTVWIKYRDENFKIGSANIGGDAIELISE